MCKRCAMRFVVTTDEDGEKNVLKRHAWRIYLRGYDYLVMIALGTVYALVCTLCLNDIFR